MDDPGPAILLAAEAAADSIDPVSLILKVALLFVLILVNAFFAMSEIAIISLNDTKMQKLAEEGNKKAKQIITENKPKLDQLAQYLYMHETITGEEFMDILNN